MRQTTGALLAPGSVALPLQEPPRLVFTHEVRLEETSETSASALTRAAAGHAGTFRKCHAPRAIRGRGYTLHARHARGNDA